MSTSSNHKEFPDPSVFVIGDSISIGYHETLHDLSEGHYAYSRKGGLEEAGRNLDDPRGANGGDSARVLAFLEEELPTGRIAAEVILVNAGLHDIKTDPKSGQRQMPLEAYRKNLEAIERVVREAGRELVWITTTPVDEERHQRHASSFHRYEADHAAYDAAAREIMASRGVPLIDLHAFTVKLWKDEGDPFRDHVHFHPGVSALQGRFVHEWLVEYLGASASKATPLSRGEPVRGWNILSDSIADGLRVIDRAGAYGINHLQLSHEIVHDLRHVRNEDRLLVAATLTRAAHAAGIQEVVLWDRVFYPLSHYPDEFRTGPGRTLDLDNPAFWEWFKADYRRLLDQAPNIQGLILTFIETATRVEAQYSETFKTDEEKLAAAVNAVADVVIGERGLNLYARTFSYDFDEYENITGAIDLFERQEIRLMMKETPHDFFLTHPNNFFPGRLARPTIVEFDAAGEFNGQGLIANTWPEYMLRRWSDFIERDHVIGYVARTDRYGKTRMIDRPSEINLLALKRHAEDRSIDAEQIYREFIGEHYGQEAYPHLRSAFGKAYGIVNATLYTLGTNAANHSIFNLDPYVSSYARHVSGKWLDPPVVRLGYGIDEELHYWKDIVNHIAPAWAKAGGAHLHEVPQVVEAGWLTPDERMDETWLRKILTQKDHGLRLAEEAAAAIEAARPFLSETDYRQLYHHFQHTLLTARLYRAGAAAYWGFRVWARGDAFRSDFVVRETASGLLQMREVANAIRDYPVKPPSGGQWNWVDDTVMAERYWEWIVEKGWPEAFRKALPTAMGGERFTDLPER
ncbi:MAG TPA: SGNH/GDSL hydrolase family protein [Oceanipulchritudo sp.]|nr:SGNH/GDSL hydrolase family protein [Oceanipulchritudo sp.]